MNHIAQDNKIMLRIDKGEYVNKTILDVASFYNLKFGWINGLGAIMNPELGYYDLKNKEYRSVNLPDTSYYIPDIIWQTNSSNLYFATLNRKQNDWNLYKYDFDTNGADLILNDSNDSWIDRDPFIVPGEIGTWTTKRGFSLSLIHI